MQYSVIIWDMPFSLRYKQLKADIVCFIYVCIPDEYDMFIIISNEWINEYINRRDSV